MALSKFSPLLNHSNRLVTVWNVPTVAKTPYYRRKKTQPHKAKGEVP